MTHKQSQHFYVFSSLNFMGMKIRRRHSLSMFFIESKLFGIAALKFSEIFRRSAAEIKVFFFFDKDNANIIIIIL